jgi:hypothetical protein
MVVFCALDVDRADEDRQHSTLLLRDLLQPDPEFFLQAHARVVAIDDQRALGYPRFRATNLAVRFSSLHRSVATYPKT